MSFAGWIRVTTFCDCEEWCVHAEVQRLAAEQHEFISTHWEIKHRRCEHGSCKSLRMAAALMEKYE